MAARPAAHVEDRTADIEQQLLLDCVGPLEVAPQRQRNDGPVAQPQVHLLRPGRGIAGEHQTLAVEAQRRDHAAIAVIAASDEAKREPGAARATSASVLDRVHVAQWRVIVNEASRARCSRARCLVQVAAQLIGTPAKASLPPRLSPTVQ